MVGLFKVGFLLTRLRALIRLLQKKNKIALPYELFRSFSLCYIDPVRHRDAANRAPYKSYRETFKGPDRTITWRPWQRVRKVISASGPGTDILGGKCGNITWALELPGVGQSNQTIHDSSGK